MTPGWADVLAYATSIAVESRRRQRVYAIKMRRGWVYVSDDSPDQMTRRPPKDPSTGHLPFSREEFDQLMKSFPRCAVRADQRHGGGMKRAIPSGNLAGRLAKTLRVRGERVGAYRCEIPHPAIGRHWHLRTL